MKSSGNAHLITSFNENYVRVTRRLYFDGNSYANLKRASRITINGRSLWVSSMSDTVRLDFHLLRTYSDSIRFGALGLLEMPANGEWLIWSAENMFIFVLAIQRHIGANRLYVKLFSVWDFYYYLSSGASFFITMMIWGISSLSIVYAKGYGALLVLRQVNFTFFNLRYARILYSEPCRVLLGIGEAGYYAGMVYYMSFWYRRYVFDIYLLTLVDDMPTL